MKKQTVLTLVLYVPSVFGGIGLGKQLGPNQMDRGAV